MGSGRFEGRADASTTLDGEFSGENKSHLGLVGGKSGSHFVAINVLAAFQEGREAFFLAGEEGLED